MFGKLTPFGRTASLNNKGVKGQPKEESKNEMELNDISVNNQQKEVNENKLEYFPRGSVSSEEDDTTEVKQEEKVETAEVKQELSSGTYRETALENAKLEIVNIATNIIKHDGSLDAEFMKTIQNIAETPQKEDKADIFSNLRLFCDSVATHKDSFGFGRQTGKQKLLIGWIKNDMHSKVNESLGKMKNANIVTINKSLEQIKQSGFCCQESDDKIKQVNKFVEEIRRICAYFKITQDLELDNILTERIDDYRVSVNNWLHYKNTVDQYNSLVNNDSTAREAVELAAQKVIKTYNEICNSFTNPHDLGKIDEINKKFNNSLHAFRLGVLKKLLEDYKVSEYDDDDNRQKITNFITENREHLNGNLDFVGLSLDFKNIVFTQVYSVISKMKGLVAQYSNGGYNNDTVGQIYTVIKKWEDTLINAGPLGANFEDEANNLIDQLWEIRDTAESACDAMKQLKDIIDGNESQKETVPVWRREYTATQSKLQSASNFMNENREVLEKHSDFAYVDNQIKELCTEYGCDTKTLEKHVSVVDINKSTNSNKLHLNRFVLVGEETKSEVSENHQSTTLVFENNESK